MGIHRSISRPRRVDPSWDERWEGPDRGLILQWERGREIAEDKPHMAQRALEGELMVLSWRGGVEKPLKPNRKLGSLYYLAMWQGLRGEDLNIDTEGDTTLTCTKTGCQVTFTRELLAREAKGARG